MNSLNQTIDIDAQVSQPPAGVYHLAAVGGFAPAATGGDSLPDRVNDLPAFYYWKDAIAVGSYVHPAKGFSLDITRDRLDGFVNNFNRMRDNGVGVPILMDHAAEAAATLGWIVDVKRDGDRFLELHQFLGEEARDIGLRNKVSLGIDPAFVDGKGNQYGEAIVHSAVTPVPVVPGQGEFEPLELAMRAEDVANQPAQAFSRAPEGRYSDPQGSAGIGHNPSTEKTALPSGARLNGDDLNLHGALQLVVEMKRDLALSRGGVTPAVAAELFELLVGSGNLLTLSRTPAGVPIALAVFDALSRNRPPMLGESTGLQVLSRSVPGDDGSLDDLRQRMIALASGERRI
jgi:hypothetical protein